MTPPRNLVLVGFMGTGKSAVGRLLARRLRRRFVDLDARIVRTAGCSIATLFAREGEAGFRVRERAAVREIAARRGLVVATGGGVVLDPCNLDDLAASGDVVCLTATPETIFARVGGNPRRPLLQGDAPLDRIRELLAQRAPRYAAIPRQVTTDGLRATEVAEAVLRALSTPPA